MTTSKKPNRWKGLVLGLLGGAAGLIAMRGYWQAVRAVSGNDPRAEIRDGPPHTSISLIGTNHQEGESSTAAVGRIIYRCIASEEPESQETRTLLSYLGALGLWRRTGRPLWRGARTPWAWISPAG